MLYNITYAFYQEDLENFARFSGATKSTLLSCLGLTKEQFFDLPLGHAQNNVMSDAFQKKCKKLQEKEDAEFANLLGLEEKKPTDVSSSASSGDDQDESASTCSSDSEEEAPDQNGLEAALQHATECVKRSAAAAMLGSSNPVVPPELPGAASPGGVTMPPQTHQGCNSKTNKAEWQKFSNLIRNPKKCPVNLQEEADRDKVNAFQLWLDCEMDAEKCGLACTRKTK